MSDSHEMACHLSFSFKGAVSLLMSLLFKFVYCTICGMVRTTVHVHTPSSKHMKMSYLWAVWYAVCMSGSFHLAQMTFSGKCQNVPPGLISHGWAAVILHVNLFHIERIYLLWWSLLLPYYTTTWISAHHVISHHYEKIHASSSCILWSKWRRKRHADWNAHEALSRAIWLFRLSCNTQSTRRRSQWTALPLYDCR